ncbi:MAG: ABC transporter ATP-binding protein [Lachnospiraceae bacterium]|nr:ABC transporter ATP-binding protein [Lachnospiraceae bacterium]
MEQTIFKAENIAKSFKTKNVYKDLSFSINRGDVLAVMGPNGVGKTTLLRTMAGLYEPDAGEITRADGEGGRSYCSVLFEFNGLYPILTLRENLAFFQSLNNNRKLGDDVWAVIGRLGLNDVIDKQVKYFSKGMLRKVAIARAVLNNPKLLILDEPFDGLDVESHAFLCDYLKDWVREGDRAIIISSHSVADIDRMCSRLMLLKSGAKIRDITIDEFKNETYIGYTVGFSEADSSDMVENSLRELGINFSAIDNMEYVLDIGIDDAPDVISKLCKRDRKIVRAGAAMMDLEKVYLRYYEEK